MLSLRPLVCSAILIGLTASTLLLAERPNKRPAGERNAISTDRLNSEGVRGELGYRLGQVITIEGNYLDGDTTRQKALSGVLLLVITKVNGKRLKASLQMRFNNAPGVARPRGAGDTPFVLVGYETGGFTGLPAEAFDHISAVATTEFHFESLFTVLVDKSNGN